MHSCTHQNAHTCIHTERHRKVCFRKSTNGKMNWKGRGGRLELGMQITLNMLTFEHGIDKEKQLINLMDFIKLQAVKP